jgi:membrane dipeptidase
MLLFDAHLDLAWNALSWNRDLTRPLAESREVEKAMTDHPGRGQGTVALPEMRRGGVAVCLSTLLCRANPKAQKLTGHVRRDLDCATQQHACAHARGQLGYYRVLEEMGEATIIKTSQELDQHWRRWEQGGGGGGGDDRAKSKTPLGFIIAMEGADPIVSPAQAQRWFNDGLRTVAIAHYGPSAYGVGTGSSGPLTPMGVELMKELDRVGMILDLTHSSDPTFFQALDTFHGPVHASHNNVRKLVPGDRQYSDEQIKLLVQRNAVIGAVCDSWQLVPNYKRGDTPREAVTLSNVADTIDYICQLAGNTNHVGIGSDLDGGFGTEQSPLETDTIADLQKLGPILLSRGYSAADVEKIFHGNWLRFFRENLPKE